ncbi:hypothetical protein JMA_37700 (plasmid) [Jeotgalibacillus malaysiensis]|uniref:DUF6273 domain-containing protein n=1 Tax=Jeotgalibacillus malaysiensis TaxID=1508404 RepID=A0A0B5AWY3_9BACL|nr:DUF6273 domain-containing protein [Jeotgalibacillus malaysiensis]AJD93088.1 hypothetical protein JMA_37700 [Jeotgalibacillus malaysiensis]
MMIERVVADGIELQGAGNRDFYGSNYWKTSNLREWANSEAETVMYTNLPPSSTYVNPSYDKEKGFLSSFLPEEKMGIAVTEHRVYLSSDDAKHVGHGGANQIDSNEYRGESVRFNLPSVDYYHDRFYQRVNDKVFLLNSYQLQQFVEKRDFPLIKHLTPEAKSKHNRTDTAMSWWMNAPSSNIGNDLNQYVSVNKNDMIATSQPKNALGFVPAINLKPLTSVNGKRAMDLTIGEIVTYGSYMGRKIEWRVINKSSDGYPLLLSEKVLDIKAYDGSGDKFSLSESNHIHFQDHDVPMKSTDVYAPFSNQIDTKEPIVKVLNDDQLFSRSNSSFTLDIEAKDAESGLNYVELPNGTRVNSERFSYTVSQNQEYVFKAKDNAGNLKVFTVPVSNINPDSTVLISSSSTGWTNKDVVVSISASNQVGFKNKTYQFNSRDYTPYVYPNFTSYTGKRIRMTGSYELIDAKAELGTITTGTGFYYRSSIKRGDDYFLNNRWLQPVRSTLAELNQNGKTTIDTTFTIPGDYFENLQAWSQIAVNSNIRDYTVRFEDLSYELLDNDDFGIEKIILPDGKEIYQESYQDILTKDGDYLYQVLDNRGKVTQKTINVKIDKTPPSLSHTLRHGGWIGNEEWIEIKGLDSLSGVKEILLPNGQVHKGTEFSYRVTQNGTYTFSVLDNAGNRFSKQVVISNFDEVNPSIQAILSETGWTNEPYRLTVKAQDNESGVSHIELPDSRVIHQSDAEYTVSENGDYTFRAFDKIGNMSDYTVKVTNFDKKVPIITMEHNGNHEDSTFVTIKVKDN